MMGLVDFIIQQIVSEVGIVGLFVLWALYQVYSPAWLPDTKLQKALGSIESEVRETKRLLISTITVLRAVVRTNDEVDSDKVDEYLVENGVEPDDFIRESEYKNRGSAGGDD